MLDFSRIFNSCQSIPDEFDHFPSEIFRLMKEEGILQLGLPKQYLEPHNTYPVFNALVEIGKANLSVGRVYEGHINALKLINDLGTASQKQFYFNAAKEGKLFSVWNTEIKSEALHAEYTYKGIELHGAKTFCSGGLHIDYALVTAQVGEGKQLLIIPLNEYPKLVEDWSLWNPMGMKNSVSCKIDFSGVHITSEYKLGELNMYEKEPWFSGGAMRFAAVQMGGVLAINTAVLDHLIQYIRTENPYQQERIGIMTVKMKSGELWISEAQKIYDQPGLYTSMEIISFANMMRTEILNIAELTLQLAEKSVGVQGFMKGHPLERIYRDLKVYLKQPGPDFALQQVGRYAFNKNQYR